LPNPIIQVQAAHNVGTLIRQAMTVDNQVIARVHDWWIIAPGIETTLPQFKTTHDSTFVDAGTPFIHGYCVGINDVPREHEASNLKFVDRFTLNVWGLYEYKLGTDQKNSEHVFVSNLKAIQDKLSRAPKLQTDGNFYGGMDGIRGHHELNFSKITPLSFPKGKVFLAEGTIEIEAIVQLTST